MMEEPGIRVLIGIIANDFARASEFSACVTELLVPRGSKKQWVIGGDWCGARNQLAARCLDEGYDYLWFMDDDHSFAPDLLQRLLSHELPMCNPLCLARIAPFPLVTYAENPDPDDPLRYLPINLDGAPEEGLVELEAGGCAGMLIRRDVLEATEFGADAAGNTTRGRWFEYTDKSEDIVFCEKAKEAGFKLYADLACRLGHITTAVVWPAVNEGTWVTGVTIGRDMTVHVPRAELLVEEMEEAELATLTTGQAPAEWAPPDSPRLMPAIPSSHPNHPDNRVDRTAWWDLPPAVDDHSLPVEDAAVNPDLVQARSSLDNAANLYPPEAPVEEAERIEIWLDEENMWWWRAIREDGGVIFKNSGISEAQVLDDSARAHPGVSVHLIREEREDSRAVSQYGPPRRMWDRGLR